MNIRGIQQNEKFILKFLLLSSFLASSFLSSSQSLSCQAVSLCFSISVFLAIFNFLLNRIQHTNSLLLLLWFFSSTSIEHSSHQENDYASICVCVLLLCSLPSSPAQIRKDELNNTTIIHEKISEMQTLIFVLFVSVFKHKQLHNLHSNLSTSL
jgi:hypothetical protein